MRARHQVLCGALLTLAVLAVHGSWTWRDQSYQANDPSFYLQVTQEIYWAGKTHGLDDAVGVAYRHRHWKPILHPALLAPFFHVADGDARQAFRLYAVVISVLLIQGVFFTLCALIESVGLAFLATLLLGLAPWFLCSQLEFGSEAPWLTASTWFLGCLIRSRDLRNGKMAMLATILLGLAVLLRPLESTVCLVVPFVFTVLALCGPLSRAWWLHVAVIGLESLAALLLIFHPQLFGTASWELSGESVAKVAGAMVAYTLIKLGFLRFSGRSAALSIQAMWSALWLMVLLWFLPCLRTLTDWILTCTIGAQSRVFAPLLERNFLLLFIEKAGVLLFLPTLLLLSNLHAVRAFWGRRRPLLYFMLWAGAVFPLIASFADNRDFRYYQVSWFVLFVAMMASVSALELRSSRRRIAISGLVALIALEAYVLLPPLFLGNEDLHRLPLRSELSLAAGDTWMARPARDERLFLDFFDQLNRLPVADDDSMIFHTPDLSTANRAGDPRKFTIRAHELGRRWKFGRYAHDGSDVRSDEDLVKQLMSRGDVLIVGPPAADAGEHADRPDNRISSALHGCAKAGCSEYGLTSIGEYTVPAGDGIAATPYLIFRHERSPAENDPLRDCYL